MRTAGRIRLRTLRHLAKWSGLAGLLSVNVAAVALILVFSRGCVRQLGGKPNLNTLSKTPSPDGRYFCVIRTLARRGTGSLEIQFALEDHNGPIVGPVHRLVEDDSNGTFWLTTWRDHSASIFTGNGNIPVFRFAGTVTNWVTEGGVMVVGQSWITNLLPGLP